MKEEIDWHALARQLGTLRQNGESSSSGHALQAIEILLGGEDNLRHAVDYYFSGKPGSELARSVLWIVRPYAAMKYCHDIYRSDSSIEIRRSAIELLGVIADKRAVNWIDEFFEDSDPEIQAWGAGLLDQLTYSYLVEPEDIEHLLAKAENHLNASVRKQAAFIRSFLSDRQIETEESRQGASRE